MNKDLRTFLGEARQLGRDYFVSVSKPVDPVFEPCVIQQKLAADGRFPAIRCQRVNGSDLPLATNLMGSYSLLGLALGIDPGESKSNILKRFRERELNPLPTKTVAREEAPVKQVVIKGDDVDLGALPIIHYAEEDSGKYITVGTLVVRDPDTGILNAGIYRHEVKGKNTLGCMSMGGLLDEPLEVTDGETVDIPVPAFAEIVIEGYLDPANETADGPFAE